MPATQRLSSKWEEDDSLPPSFLAHLSHLLPIYLYIHVLIYTRKLNYNGTILLFKFSFVQILTRKCEVGFKPRINFKMLHTNQAELNQIYGTFCRVWAAGGQATLTTTSLGFKVTAKLELELGQPTDARPGAPPPHLHTAKALYSQHGAPVSGAARRPCHRGPADKAKSRARAAAHQAAKAAAAAASVSSTQQNVHESTRSTPVHQKKLLQSKLPVLHWQLANP